jgi:hypothetical protein
VDGHFVLGSRGQSLDAGKHLCLHPDGQKLEPQDPGRRKCQPPPSTLLGKLLLPAKMRVGFITAAPPQLSLAFPSLWPSALPNPHLPPFAQNLKSVSPTYMVKLLTANSFFTFTEPRTCSDLVTPSLSLWFHVSTNTKHVCAKTKN